MICEKRASPSLEVAHNYFNFLNYSVGWQLKPPTYQPDFLENLIIYLINDGHFKKNPETTVDSNTGPQVFNVSSKVAKSIGSTQNGTE